VLKYALVGGAKTKRKLDARMLRRIILGILVALMIAPEVGAAGLTNRSDSMSTSQANVTSTHVVSFRTATGSNIGSVGMTFCTTATGACTVPGGLVTTSATLGAQSGVSGFTLVNTTNGAPYVTNAGAPLVGAATQVSFTLDNITNPTAVNATFFVRITTYTGTDGATGAVDTGNVAVSTAQPINLTGVTPEILVFCVGTTITSDCTTVSGNSIDFGDFSPVATRTGTSVMQAQTNAANGYNITVNGTTLASGVNTIPGLAAQTASTVGTSQFGLNVGVAGGGSGSVDANYNNAGLYRFNNGDRVGLALLPTNANTFTSNYIVNIVGSQAAGVYTATMTYICTASF
jgi:hypothetical protein